ncbi:MAG TPA: MYG1 family protein [Kiritimatiellia bacterium]|mgnify:CR=1 FL=1|nr:MYG1 family protein [Kiritimatiellia bacterium]HMO98505.1 MYG1 family protein [Kiritimatiellia bacterium]HMP95813.1 MYG1 family protein [Kiritimatiellia bacterium]
MNTQTTNPAALPRRIITHAGSAHADEVVSIALLLAADETVTSISRVPDVTPAELDDASVYVLDTGCCHDPGRLNFDHHQFDPEDTPRCTLSLVLEHLGLESVARRCWPWLEAFERLDAGGPRAVEKLFGIHDLALILPQFRSPLEEVLVDIFSMKNAIRPDDMLWRFLWSIGQHLLAELRQLPDLIDGYEKQVISGVRIPPDVKVEVGKPFIAPPEWIDDIILLKWPDAPRSLARKAFQVFLREKAPEARLTITPDERGPGFVLTSVSDSDPIDFRFLVDDPEIAFIHATGFMAVTRSQDVTELDRLSRRMKEKP